MLILGLSEDLFDAGASLTDGERVLFASNERRRMRRKKSPKSSAGQNRVLFREKTVPRGAEERRRIVQ
ncbi:MAG: hypothetical protein GXY15_03965 [Candidatus Hydrogenedentes bacterium]|nr:hypothetical protein [Candidatus Hydrogenedentota bacterium]